MPSSRPSSARAGRPRNSRPAQRGGPGRVRAAAAQRRLPRPRITNRAAILLVVFAALIVSYASSMRAYLEQRSHIEELEAVIAETEAQIAVAEREKKRWQDPAYVQAQARARFGWVMPGEVAYEVLGADGEPIDGSDSLSDPAQEPAAAPAGWWEKVHDSWDAADHPELLVRKPTPVTKITPDQTKN